MKLGNPAGIGATGGGYLQTIVITSSPSISRFGWKRTTMLLVNTRMGSYENTQLSNKNTHMGRDSTGGGATGGGYRQTMVMISSPSISSAGWKRTTTLFVNTLCGSCGHRTQHEPAH